MKKTSIALALLIVSKYSFALNVTRDEIYNACLVVETKHAAADGQEDPKLAAHYLCTIIADDCVAKPDGQHCNKAKQKYGLNSADKPNHSEQKNTYGLSELNPILLGSATGRSDAKALRSYMDHLSGPKGEKIKYRRVGACCGFKTPRGLFDGTGVLEVWEVIYDGLSKPTQLFINVYDQGELSAPAGFLLQK